MNLIEIAKAQVNAIVAKREETARQEREKLARKRNEAMKVYYTFKEMAESFEQVESFIVKEIEYSGEKLYVARASKRTGGTFEILNNKDGDGYRIRVDHSIYGFSNVKCNGLGRPTTGKSDEDVAVEFGKWIAE